MKNYSLNFRLNLEGIARIGVNGFWVLYVGHWALPVGSQSAKMGNSNSSPGAIGEVSTGYVASSKISNF